MERRKCIFSKENLVTPIKSPLGDVAEIYLRYAIPLT